MPARYRLGTTVRSTNFAATPKTGPSRVSARATYRPDFNPARPWHTYIGGSAERYFAELDAAIASLERKGFTFDRNTLPQPEDRQP